MYVAFVIAVFVRCSVGWRVNRSMQTDLVLNALEQALHASQAGKGLIHHSDRGSQYLSIRDSERLEPTSHVPPAQFEAEHFRQQIGLILAA